MEILTKWLAVIFSLICLPIVFYVGWKFLFTPSVNERVVLISCTSCLMAIANAFLLYATLSSQREYNKQERFETTFFNLLDNHRRLFKILTFDFTTKDLYMNVCTEKICEEKLFVFANRELQLIKQVFRDAEYPAITDEEVQNEMETIGYLKDRDKESVEDGIVREKALSRLYSLSQRCNLYNITKSIWEQPYNGKAHLSEIAYKLFINKWGTKYAPYFRSLILMFNHIGNSSLEQNDKVRYRNYIIHQLSDYERKFITLHYSYYAYQFKDYRFKDSLDAISKDKDFISDSSRLGGEDNCKS